MELSANCYISTGRFFDPLVGGYGYQVACVGERDHVCLVKPYTMLAARAELNRSPYVSRLRETTNVVRSL